MYNAHPHFVCFPSVVHAGKEATITVYPTDTSRRFREGMPYKLTVFGLVDDQLDYQSPDRAEHDFTIEGGCLRFTHNFDSEQEYRIRLTVGSDPVNLLSVYAVEEDLYKLRPLKGDLHSHCYYSDGADGLTMTPADYREEGFDFFALTDHNRMFTSRLAQKMYDGVELGMHIMAGEEVHTPGSSVHIVHAGGNHSICEQYINSPDVFKDEIEAIEAELSHIPEQFRGRVARATWTCRKAHEAGGIAIFAHPFWAPDHYNVSDTLQDLLFEERIFDAFELCGGISTKSVNQQLALWQKHAMAGNRLNVVGSSDSHHHNIEKEQCGFGHRFTLVFARENATPAILEAIKSGYSVAAELPIDKTGDVRFYGDLRLVTFAQFLYENYFAHTWKLCIIEGILMRRWALGEDVGKILTALAPSVENYYKRFYGLTPAPVLSERQTAFLDEALAQQQAGPLTKGSHIYIYSNNSNKRRE